MLDSVKVFAKVIAECGENHGPYQSADRIAQREHAEWHFDGAGYDSCEHSKYRNEARDDYRPGTVLVEVRVDSLFALRVNAYPATIARDERHSTCPSDPVAPGTASDGPDPRGRRDTDDAEVALCRECTGREQDNLARQRKPHAFERDEAGDSEVTVCANEFRYAQRLLMAW